MEELSFLFYLILIHFNLKNDTWHGDFPGGPVVNILPFKRKERGSDPWSDK